MIKQDLNNEDTDGRANLQGERPLDLKSRQEAWSMGNANGGEK